MTSTSCLRSSRRKRRAKKAKAVKLRRFKVYMHLTVCPAKARKPKSGSWYVSNDPDYDPGIYWTCKTCGLGYLYRWNPDRLEFYDFGETVSKEYHGEFPFTGTLHSVAVDLSGDLIVDDEAAVRQLMAQQ